MIYKIIMKKNDFFKIHNRIASKNLEIKEDEVYFEIELGSLNILKETGYPFHMIDSLRIKLQSFFKKYYLIGIGLLFLFSVLYLNTYRVTSIEFNMETPINAEIESQITLNMKRLFCFDFTNMNFESFSKKLRTRYVEYPYIEVYAKNNKINVDIYSQNEESPKSITGESCGDIIAKKDGVIDTFYIYDGVSKISKNKYVRQGDILISGTMNDESIPSKGLILAYTYERVCIDVKKKESKEVETSNKEEYFSISFINSSFNLNKKNLYSISNVHSSKVFNIFDIFAVNKVEEIEKSIIATINSEDDAIKIAEKIITEDFEENKVNNLEKIIDMKMYKLDDNGDAYSVTYILKKLESIGEFSSY